MNQIFKQLSKSRMILYLVLTPLSVWTSVASSLVLRPVLDAGLAKDLPAFVQASAWGLILAVLDYVAYYFALTLPAGVLCWLFPLLGRFEYTVAGLFRAALQLTVAHLPSTVVVVLLTAQTAVFCVQRWWPVLFMPVIAMLLVSLFFERIFQKHSPELAAQEESDPNE